MKKVKIKTEDDTIEYSSLDNLFFSYQREPNITLVWLYEDLGKKNKELGLFEVWFDDEMDKREYIILNHEITYLDTLSEL